MFATPHGIPTSTTQVPGHLSVVVDPVPRAWTNLASLDWAERQAAAAHNVGLCATRKLPCWFEGLVRALKSCRHVATLPIAVPNTIHPGFQGATPSTVRRGESTTFNLETPVVEGDGRDLPALLGLSSMSNHNAVLEMAPGREMLTLTATGEYSPSRHLVFKTDAFNSIPRRSGGFPPTIYGLCSHMNRQYQDGLAN